MADYASIMGGNAPEGLIGQSVGLNQVGRDWDAFYFVESANVFIDRFDSSGYGEVDARANPNAVRVELGSGSDVINTGGGNDTIWAGDGNDVVNAAAGSDTVAGGGGDDLLRGGNGDDSLSGGDGDDILLAGLGRDYLVGGSGNDTVRGEEGDDSLFGGKGADAILGDGGDDSLVGGEGADTLDGGAGDDSLFGGSDGDVFAFDNGFGQDVIADLRPGDRIQLAEDLNDSGIRNARDLLDANNPEVSVTGGTTAAGTKFTVITVGGDTIRLERVDYNDFINQIETWVQVG